MPYADPEIAKKKRREYYQRNRERILARVKGYAETHKKERCLANRRWSAENKDHLRQYCSDPERKRRRREQQKCCQAKNRGKVSAYLKLYNKRNADRLREWRRKYRQVRYQTQIDHRLKMKLKARMQFALRVKGARKHERTMVLIGCTIQHLRAHLEHQFRRGMSWDNYGRWHIDHIRPCASFDLTDPEQQRACFHWSNLRPMWAKANRRKYAKWDGQPELPLFL